MKALAALMDEKYRKRFGQAPDLLVVSPGRVNLIGEHTDYNEGFVLPGAVDKAVVFALGRRADDHCHLLSNDYGQEFRCELGSFNLSPLHWPNYLLGVMDQLAKAGRRPGGFNCVFGGNIPIGAGMSSSAAIEAGLAFGLNELFGLGLDPISLVKLSQKAENEFVGVNCGIMDQFVNIHGRAKSVLRLDCRSLEFEYFPFEREDVRVVVTDTLVRRELAGSEYNVRRRQCEAGVGLLSEHHPEVRSLRDATLEMLAAHRDEFDPVVFRRCDYVVRENLRVIEACRALQAGDLKAFGALMNASHLGLKNDYEVSSPELDILVEAALTVPGVFGSRMMGAGFGGCTISLVEADAVPAFRESVTAEYERATGRTPKFYVVTIEAGTRLMTPGG